VITSVEFDQNTLNWDEKNVIRNDGVDQCHAAVMVALKGGIRHPLFSTADRFD